MRATTLAEIQNRLIEMVRKALENRDALRETLATDVDCDKLEELAGQKALLVADVPSRPLGTGGTPPPVLLTFAEEKECLGCAKAAYLQPFPAPTDSFLNRKINKRYRPQGREL